MKNSKIYLVLTLLILVLISNFCIYAETIVDEDEIKILIRQYWKAMDVNTENVDAIKSISTDDFFDITKKYFKKKVDGISIFMKLEDYTVKNIGNIIDCKVYTQYYRKKDKKIFDDEFKYSGYVNLSITKIDGKYYLSDTNLYEVEKDFNPWLGLIPVFLFLIYPIYKRLRDLIKNEY